MKLNLKPSGFLEKYLTSQAPTLNQLQPQETNLDEPTKLRYLLECTDNSADNQKNAATITKKMPGMR